MSIIIKAILHYNRLDLTQALVTQVPDAIVFDAKGNYVKVKDEEVIKIPNAGFSANWNAAFEKLIPRGWDWIWIANNDIKILNTPPSDFFRYVEEAISTFPKSGIISGVFNAAWENCRPNSTSEKFVVTHGVEFTAPFIKRELLTRCNFFPPQPQNGFGIDILYAQWAKYLDYQAIVVQQAEFYHYGSQSGIEIFGSIEKYLEQGFKELEQFVTPKIREMKRQEIIQLFIDKRGYKSYCEIGVGDGGTFEGIKCEKKIGLDPSPSKQIEGVINITAPLFFASGIVAKEEKFDIIFIDGDHRAEFVFTDYYFSKRYLSNNGVIIFHDVNPPSEWHTRTFEEFRKTGGEWCGNAYLGFLHAANDAQKHYYTIATDFGVGIIDFARGNKKVNLNIPITYAMFDSSRKDYLNLITPEEFLELL